MGITEDGAPAFSLRETMGHTSMGKGDSSFNFPVIASLTPFRLAKRWGTRSVSHIGRHGLWVVLLGPDGAGKSSVLAELTSKQPALFAGYATYHLRPTPSRGRREPRANCDPHGQPVRGTLISVFKLVYLLVANWLGYLVSVQPQLAHGKLVLFDRYFPDCLVDPKRYRLPASCQRITDLIARLLPQPDLYVVLDAPASVLQERKHEVTPAESERQGKDYATRSATLPNVAVVDAVRPLADVVEDVFDRILELRLARCRERYEVA